MPAAVDHLNHYSPVPGAGCWLYLGKWDRKGYGRVPRVGLAHRVFYAALVGDIPEGAVVCHKCDTPACVNPEHLFVGPQGDNLGDMTRKGRRAVHSRHGRSKLSSDDVAEIRKLLASRVSQSAIGREFGVAQTCISHIATGKNWRPT